MLVANSLFSFTEKFLRRFGFSLQDINPDASPLRTYLDNPQAMQGVAMPVMCNVTAAVWVDANPFDVVV